MDFEVLKSIEISIGKSFANPILFWLADYSCMNDKDDVGVRDWTKKSLINNFQTKSPLKSWV